MDEEEKNGDEESPFREQAVDRLSSPEQLDKLMQVITPKGWIALLCFLGLIVIAILWAFMGRIPVEVDGKGIILTEKGLFSFSATADGVIAELPVGLGSWVTPDTIIAKVYDQTALNNIKAQELKYDELVAKSSEEEIIKQQAAVIEQLRKNIPTVNIYAHEVGKIVEIDASVGDYLQVGDLVGWAQYPLEKGETLICHAYFRIGEGEQIHPHMPAKMGLENVDVESFGYLQGKVSYVSAFPISDKDLDRLVRNPQLVSFIKQGALAVIAAHIIPIEDANTVSGYAWTSKKGPDAYVKSGTICNVKVITANRRPISYLFPQWFPPEQQPLGVNPNIYPGKL